MKYWIYLRSLPIVAQESTMRFTDIEPTAGGSGYGVVNENLNAWKKLLEGISVERAAGICSAGEVNFFSILPHVEQELVLIDQSPYSLYCAMGKYHNIETLGPEKAHNQLCKELKKPFTELPQDFAVVKHTVTPNCQKV